jgi:putative ABC transport system permease protein
VIAGRTKAVDQIFGLVNVLMLLALVIAVLGVANTLALSISERTRELGLLRAVGMARRQVAIMIQLEAALVSVLAVVTGVGLGFGAGFATVGALGQVAPLDAVVPLPQVLGFAALIGAAGLVAAIAPARRAARTPVLEAIADA